MQPELNPYAPPTSDYQSPPQPVDGTELPAERGTRFVSSLVDSLLYLPLVIPGFMFIGLEAFKKSARIASFEMMLFTLPLAILQWYRIVKSGQSIAKRWFGIKIVKMDGSPVSFETGVALRSWIPHVIGQLPYVGVIFAFVDALFIFGSERRCIHDLIAGTRVVVVRK